MEICEFKAWFEGFTEDMTETPNAKQWKRIKARVKQVDGTATTERVFIDRYWHWYEPYFTQPYWTNGSLTMTTAPQQFSNNASNSVLNVNHAFTALGKAEAAFVVA